MAPTSGLGMNRMTLDCALAAGLCCLSVVLWQRRHTKSSRLPLPPGPPCWPVLGSLLSIPADVNLCEVFAQWGEDYGDILYAKIFGKDTIILNSHDAAVELLERRSNKYSGRVRTVMAGEMVGWDRALGLIDYGDRTKRIRKLLHEGTSTKAMPELWPLQEREAIKFVQRLLETPNELDKHIRQTAGATVLKLTYGYDVKDRNDRFLVLVEAGLAMFSKVASTVYLVDIFPSLRHLPWAPFKTQAMKWRKLVDDVTDLPFEFVQEGMKSGELEPCLTARWLERDLRPNEQSKEEAEYTEWLIKCAAQAIYGAGSDTTASLVASFFVAMTHYPDVQAKAQAEITRVVGSDRLPTYSDRDSLPYIEAVYKELLRWRPPAPLGIPHRLDSEEDDEYQGLRIPASSTIFSNVWNMVRDPKAYREPEVFNPERFLGAAESIELNPEDIIFGFGRRRCPGISVAQSSIWFSITLTLATYNITPALDANGRPKMPSLKIPTGILIHPEPFECTITPRSPHAARLVKAIHIS